jgi:hypothetical protein
MKTPRFLLVALFAAKAQAFTVVLDYTYDSTGFFTSNLVAKAALEQAATDLSNLITSPLGAISPSSMSFTGNVSGTTATADWKLSFSNPTTAAAVELTSYSAAAGEFRVFVGMRSLSGSTLGQGGPAGMGLNFGGGGTESNWVAAVSAMNTASNAVMMRGGGQVIGNFSGNFTLGATDGAYSLNYGAIAGTLWFDNDADNNGSADGDLSTYWHFNHATGVGGGLNDFYSVALHEILHSMGFGTGATWDGNVSGASWLGTQAIAEHGTGANLIDTGSGAHIADNTMSLTLAGSLSQEVVMGPSIVTGTRKTLTELDAAFLQDLGYSVAAIPEPSTCALLFGAGVLGLAVWRRRAA